MESDTYFARLPCLHMCFNARFSKKHWLRAKNVRHGFPQVVSNELSLLYVHAPKSKSLIA
jgi:hypothetical protein